MNKTVIGILILFVAFLFILLLSNIFKIVDLPSGVMGALLGSIVTIMITGLLLKGQAVSDELKERNVKVFE